MTKKTRSHVEDLRAVSRLAVEATQGVTGLVEAMHRTIASGPALLGRPLEGPAGLITGLVYGNIRGVTHLVGAGIDLALAQLAPLLGESVPGPERAAVLAVLNGVLGDYLKESGSALATPMQLCYAGHPLEVDRRSLREALPQATPKLLVLVHGSSANDVQWNHRGHDHGAALASDLGYTPIYLRYNSGLHISLNGREFAAQLERLIEEWPSPIEELVLVGHSMGGLVARSACYLGEQAGHEWRRRLSKLVCIGTPHHGAPLERGGNWVDVLLGVSRYSAPLARLGKIRSAGVTDLRFGNLLDEDWNGHDRFARRGDTRTAVKLPAKVECYAIAGTKSLEMGGKLRSDGLVPVASALGQHENAQHALAFPEANRWIALGVNHLDSLSSKEVYETIKSWLST